MWPVLFCFAGYGHEGVATCEDAGDAGLDFTLRELAAHIGALLWGEEPARDVGLGGYGERSGLALKPLLKAFRQTSETGR